MKPVVNWNISKDRLMFVEEEKSTTFFLVKLFEDKKPIIYKFKMPESVNDEIPPIDPEKIKKELNPLAKMLFSIKKTLKGEAFYDKG